MFWLNSEVSWYYGEQIDVVTIFFPFCINFKHFFCEFLISKILLNFYFGRIFASLWKCVIRFLLNFKKSGTIDRKILQFLKTSENNFFFFTLFNVGNTEVWKDFCTKFLKKRAKEGDTKKSWKKMGNLFISPEQRDYLCFFSRGGFFFSNEFKK